MSAEADQAVPAAEAIEAAEKVRTQQVQALNLALESHDARLYAVVDAARDAAALSAVYQHDSQPRHLFEGRAEEPLLDVVPYFLSAPPDSGLTANLLAQGLGRSWGMWILTPADAPEPLNHFQGLVDAVGPDGTELLFRFYDPRVAKAFLPTCTPAEARRFFGPAVGLILESGQPQGLMMLHLENDQLVETTIYPEPGAEVEPVKTPLAAGPDEIDPNAPVAVRPEQMEALSQYVRQSFLQRFVDQLRQWYPDRAAEISPEEALGVAGRMFDAAQEHELTDEDDVAVLVEAGFLLGDEVLIDSVHQAALAHLNDGRLDPSAKAERFAAALFEPGPDERTGPALVPPPGKRPRSPLTEAALRARTRGLAEEESGRGAIAGAE